VWIDALGNIASVYRKLHLYGRPSVSKSRTNFIPARSSPHPVAIGQCQFGVMICYALRFPEMARMLALRGRECVAAPSGWGSRRSESGTLANDDQSARALENGCYVVAPDQTGNIYIGHSMIVDPLGRTVVDLGTK